MNRLVAWLVPLLCALPAGAQEQYEGPAYLIGCADDGCALNAAGFNLFAPADGAGFDTLRTLDPVTAVGISGSLSDMGDSSATIRLTAASRIENDPYEATLRQMQGNWRPRGDAMPFSINIVGLDWTELPNGEIGDSYLISPGSTCPDAAMTPGMVFSLYLYGGDPEADACWQVEFVDAQTLSLRDASGGGRFVDFDREEE